MINIKNMFNNINILKRIKLKQWLIIFVIVLAIGGIITSVYYFNKYQALKANPNLGAQKEVETLVKSVSKLMELPADETPTVATIADKDKLKDQPFFAKAENGDKLLAYTKAMQAILYRPSANRIINVAPILIDQKQGVTNAPISQKTDNLKIAYYNGTKTVGLSGQAEKLIKSAYPNYQTDSLTNASKKDYTETLVIDLFGTHSQEAKKIATLLGGKVSVLPEGENRPDADILIISGQK
jgi:hypothetical protein